MALAYRVAPWLCGLMDSVLSVEGSQIYRQSAFNKKQVACKVHCRATKDVNTSETTSIRIEMLLVEGRVGYYADAHFALNLSKYWLSRHWTSILQPCRGIITGIGWNIPLQTRLHTTCDYFAMRQQWKKQIESECSWQVASADALLTWHTVLGTAASTKPIKHRLVKPTVHRVSTCS